MGIILILGVFLIGVLIGIVVTLAVKSGANGVSGINKAAGEKKEERKAKILEILKNTPQGRLKNDDVQKVLGVSDASVTNYFDELEREGRVRQVGDGSAAYYELK